MAQFVKNHKEPYEALTQAVSNRPLAGKSALITGAGRGVGQHITRGIAAAGASKIAILGRDQKRIDSARDNFAAEYPETAFVGFSANVTDEEAIAAVFDAFGTPDIVVNNAGQFPDDGPFLQQNLRTWWTSWETNVLGSAVVAQKFLQTKYVPSDAVVLNVSSMAAHMRFPLIGWSGYNGSKLAQVRIFENIRFEHPNVRFVNVHPGSIESDGFTRSGASAPPDGMTDGKLVGQFFAWLATHEADFLAGRFVWAEWDIEELKGRQKDIEGGDLLMTTIDGFTRGFF
jgi:NAD(P)-dependent dehydrogenase (short-subunit alcohol dehydrogenase family)